MQTKQTKILFISILSITIFVSAISAQKQKADLIIVDAKVYTMDDKRPEAQAIAIKGNKIIAVEKKFGKIEKYRDKNTRQINARGRAVIPGFNDSHTHFMGIGNMFSSIDLRNVRGLPEVIGKMKFYVKYIPKGRWILGGGWDENTWGAGRLPSKDLIDAVTPNNPVFIYNSDGTMALANSLALKLAKIDRNKSNVKNGEFVRDENGDLIGLLKGDAIVFVKNAAPLANTKKLFEVAESATNYAASLGVTSIQDMHSDYIADVFREVQRQGKLKTRIYDCTPLYDWKKLADAGIKRATGDALVRTGCLKGLTDGVPEEESQLYEFASNADKADLQVMIHSIGTSSNSLILKVFERIFAEDGIKDRRFRIEHAHNFLDEDLKRFVNPNLIASMQPHLFGGTDPFEEMLDEKATIAFGSDASITDFNPLLGIHEAVNTNYTFDGKRQNISVAEAVRLYTVGSAYAEFQENVKGSISVGKLADIVILSQNIFEIEPEKIKETEVIMTIMDGKIVYNKRAE